MYKIQCAWFVFIVSFFGLQGVANATTLWMGGSGSDLGTMKILAQAYSKKHLEVAIKVLPSLGSNGGLKALKAGRLDLVLLSRGLKKSEKSPQLQAVLYATTPLVFVASPYYAHQSMTTRQIQKIYDGSHPYWPDGRVSRSILRHDKDSDVLVLKQSSPDYIEVFEKAYQRKVKLVAFTDQESADMVENVEGAIGTSALSLILSENRTLQPIVLDGVKPSVENLKNGQYTLKKSLYFAYSANPSHQLQRFLDFVQSAEGQQILLDTGHVPVPF